MLLVVRLINPVIEVPLIHVCSKRALCLDPFKSVRILEHETVLSIAWVSNDDFPSLSLVVLVNKENLRLLRRHGMCTLTRSLELNRGCKV